MKKLKSTIILTMLIVMANQTSINAHGNESVEGHSDFFNISGLGNYHYHHGYEAHLHPNGVCEYREAEKQNLAKKQGTEDGYEYGYLGLDKEYRYSENDAYYSMYKNSYDESYEEGKNKAESESKAYYNIGKELGKIGKSLEGSYDNKIFDKAYRDGYNDGYKEYKAKVTKEYKEKGFNDGKLYNTKISFDGLEDYMINAYESGYSEGLLEYAKKVRDNGYSAAFGNGNKNPSYTEDENKWYDEGFNEGLKALDKIKDEARALGRAGKDESELDKFKEGRNEAIKAFEEGRKERLDRERLIKLFLVFMGITIVGIGFVLVKMKNEKEYDIDDKVA